MGTSMELQIGNTSEDLSDRRNIHDLKETPQTTEHEIPSIDQRDAQALARLGKKPVLKVCDLG